MVRRASEVIERTPGILGGTGVFKGTRVPIRSLLDYLEEGRRLEEFLADFPTVTREQADAVLELPREALAVEGLLDLGACVRQNGQTMTLAEIRAAIAEGRR
jgi:uncharacterized protein (DUF433 family)